MTNRNSKSTPLVEVLLSGCVSGTFSTILLQPLDVIKTRLQSTHLSDGVNKKSGILKITKEIILKENFTTLWRGVTPSLWRTVPGMSLYFTGIHLMTSNATPTSLQAISAGIISRSTVGVLLAPFTVVKTRFESSSFKYKSMFEALMKIFHTEGFRGLWSGTLPAILRDAPYSGLYFMFYTKFKTFKPEGIQENDPEFIFYQFSCGGVAGFAATLLTQPADIIKTRMQLCINVNNNKSRLKRTLVEIYKNDGMSGFVKGFVPRMLKRTLMGAISWTIFEQFTFYLKVKER